MERRIQMDWDEFKGREGIRLICGQMDSFGLISMHYFLNFYLRFFLASRWILILGLLWIDIDPIMPIWAFPHLSSFRIASFPMPCQFRLGFVQIEIKLSSKFRFWHWKMWNKRKVPKKGEILQILVSLIRQNIWIDWASANCVSLRSIGTFASTVNETCLFNICWGEGKTILFAIFGK